MLSRIFAVVVAYRPDPNKFQANIESLLKQVERVVIVHNGHKWDWAFVPHYNSSNIIFIHNGANLGVAAALNIGINIAKNSGADFVLLMDQDSYPVGDMVETLNRSLCTRVMHGDNVAAIGPILQDSQNASISRVSQARPLCGKHAGLVAGQDVVPTDFLISSGSLIPIRVLSEIGEMDETLFIDHVDTEWGLRARARGYVLLQSCRALMEHSLGERRLRVRLIRTRNVPLHKPFRYYYMVRNSIILYKRGYICRGWKRFDLVRLAQIVLFMTVFHDMRFQVLRFMGKGFWDGLRNKDGPMK